MKLSETGKFRRAVQSALAMGAACSAFGTVSAQEAAPAGTGSTELDKIEVTGSRLRQSDFETASPVFVIDRAAIETSGVATVGQLLQEMPTIAGAATNPQVNNGGGTGAATVSLRGLGSARTLVLLNGRRLVDSPATDVNAIPINMIERVEVLKDGASAIYGSDAVGGVVNFITRKNYQGSELIAGHGSSSRSDAQLTNYWTTFGTGTQKGNIQFGLNFDRRNPVISADRDFSEDPFALYYGQKISLGSSRSFPGRYRVPGGAGGTFDCDGDGNFTQAVTLTRIGTEDGRDVSDYRCFVSGGAVNDLYDFQDVNVVVTPQERYGTFLQGDYKLADSTTFFAEAMYHKTSASFQIAPEPFDGRPSQANVPASADSVYNPFGVNITDLRLRLVPVGNREEQFDTDRFQGTIGLKGDLSAVSALSSFRWDAFASLGKLQQTSEAHGEIYTTALAAALGPSFDNADNDPSNGIQEPVCGTANTAATGAPPPAPTVVEGCVPVDFFGIPDGAALASIAPFVHDRTDQNLTSFGASVNGEVAQLPAGPLGIALGYSYGEDSLDFKPDFLRSAALISGNSSSPIFGKFDLSEAYVEFGVPVLADMPGVKALNLSLGLRYSDYSTFGTTTNAKYGVEYRPIDGLLVRGTYADVFRSPTIVDLFSGQFESADTFTDPCNGLTTPVGTNANIDAACENVARDGSYGQTDTQLNAIVGGNSDLVPEEGNTTTFGFVYNPEFYDPLSVTVDYWKYELDNNIGTVGSDIRLRQCFNNGLFCDSIFRDADGEISRVEDQTDNIGRLDTTGVDVGLRLAFKATEYGQFGYALDMTFLGKYDNEALAGDPSTIERFAGRFKDVSAGGDGHFAKVRALSNLSWRMSDLTATLSNRYIGEVTEGDKQLGLDGGAGTYNAVNDTNLPCSQINQQTPAPTAPVVCERTISAQLISDVSVSYFLRQFNTSLTVGVDNFTDEIAPLIYSGFNGTTDVRTYDGIGTFYWARIKYSIQ